MNEIDLNIFQKIFTYYSEATGYNVELLYLFLLLITLGILIANKITDSDSAILSSIYSTILAISITSLFTIYVLDVKALNEQLKEIEKQEKVQKIDLEKEKITKLYKSIDEEYILKQYEENPSYDDKLEENKLELARLLIKYDKNPIEKIQKFYLNTDYKIALELSKVLRYGTDTIFKDESKYKKYKNDFLNTLCKKDECSKPLIKSLNKKNIKYLSDNNYFNIKQKVSFYQGLDRFCDAAKIAYSISKDYGNKLAKKHNCIQVYNSRN